MTIRALCVACALVVALGAACEKTNDLPRVQDEAMALVKRYQGELDELAHRAEAIRTHGGAALDAGDAGRRLRQAVGLIDDRRRDLQQVTGTLDTMAKAGRTNDLHQAIDLMRERFEKAVTEATWDLSAVESALAQAERQAPR